MAQIGPNGPSGPKISSFPTLPSRFHKQFFGIPCKMTKYSQALLLYQAWDLVWPQTGKMSPTSNLCKICASAYDIIILWHVSARQQYPACANLWLWLDCQVVGIFSPQGYHLPPLKPSKWALFANNQNLQGWSSLCDEKWQLHNYTIIRAWCIDIADICKHNM